MNSRGTSAAERTGMNRSPTGDEMVRAIKRGNRRPLLGALGIFGALVAGSGLWVLKSYSPRATPTVAYPGPSMVRDRMMAP